ncbi:hypothetical protein [Dyadobacter sp. OTU695]|uniref:hypothetical protein n=1 Tax=Dyadobacter sp. OTU695 TaxID=3043860 RepID=UPI00313C6F0E
MNVTSVSNVFSTRSKWNAVPLTALLVLMALAADAQVGIGTTMPDASAQLDVTSDKKGVLVPRLTTVQRTAILTPADGLLVYDTDAKGFWYFKNGTGWVAINNAAFTLPYSGSGNDATPLFSIKNQGAGHALVAMTEGEGNGIIANALGHGNGVVATAYGNGHAIFGSNSFSGIGGVARFVNFNTWTPNPVLSVSNAGLGTTISADHTGAGGDHAIFQNFGVNVVRISKTGVGFFNGGTQNSGADIAESFDVLSEVSDYEPGDVLSIATSRDRTIEKSAGAYSDLVLGVYATKPGVLLTEENIDSDLTGKVPMGVVGVIPTKVCGEGGMIRRGDLLVTSSIPGVAMKADKGRVQAGQVLGKALQNFDGNGVGKINVFVNVK